MTMVPKVTRYPLEISRDELILNSDIHVRYANLDFSKGGVPPGAGPVLRWFKYKLDWSRHRIIQFLKEHQKQFRDCLQWLSEDCVVDYEPSYGHPEGIEDYEWGEKWRNEPLVQFLQLHGIEHGGIQLVPLYHEGQYFDGLQIAQSKCHDPLDPLCWYLLAGLNFFRNRRVRRCRNPKCGKFFFQPTQRKLCCSDSCRARYAVMVKRLRPGGWDKFKRDRAEYMRNYNKLPQVKKRRRISARVKAGGGVLVKNKIKNK
jgi:hypothetical protein